MDKVKKSWERYQTTIIPENVGEIQVLEMKVTFYAGAKSATNLFMNTAIENESQSDDIAASALEDLITEIDNFFIDLVDKAKDKL